MGSRPTARRRDHRVESRALTSAGHDLRHEPSADKMSYWVVLDEEPIVASAVGAELGVTAWQPESLSDFATHALLVRREDGVRTRPRSLTS
jgi:hypothetical protein